MSDGKSTSFFSAFVILIISSVVAFGVVYLFFTALMPDPNAGAVSTSGGAAQVQEKAAPASAPTPAPAPAPAAPVAAPAPAPAPAPVAAPAPAPAPAKTDSAASSVDVKAVIAKGSCSACHSVLGKTSAVGPSLENVGSRLSSDEIRQSIVDPNAVIAAGYAPMMPGNFGTRLSKDEIDALVKFLSDSK